MKEAQTSYLWEEYEVTPGHAREFQMEEIPERSELKRCVLEVKDAIRKLGSVNVNAIEAVSYTHLDVYKRQV